MGGLTHAVRIMSDAWTVPLMHSYENTINYPTLILQHHHFKSTTAYPPSVISVWRVKVILQNNIGKHALSCKVYRGLSFNKDITGWSSLSAVIIHQCSHCKLSTQCDAIISVLATQLTRCIKAPRPIPRQKGGGGWCEATGIRPRAVQYPMSTNRPTTWAQVAAHREELEMRWERERWWYWNIPQKDAHMWLEDWGGQRWMDVKIKIKTTTYQFWALLCRCHSCEARQRNRRKKKEKEKNVTKGVRTFISH